MTVDQIENSMRSDTVWDRPSWPLKGNYEKAFEEFNDFIDDFVINENELLEINKKNVFNIDKIKSFI